MEFVFVVPRARLFSECAPHGVAVFGDEWSQDAFETCVREDGFFVERAYAEEAPHLKQVIPYTLVARGQEFLLLQRTKGGGESRLHDKLSLGVGGHVNPVDAIDTNAGAGARRLRAPLPAATRREVLEEELIVEGETRLRTVGLLNDDTNAVGAVHVGLVQVLELLDGDVPALDLAPGHETQRCHGDGQGHEILIARQGGNRNAKGLADPSCQK